MIDSLYIHIPFCNRKCNYCDFYILTNMPNQYERYTEYIVKELKLYKKNIYDTIYFGGGTPSVLSIEQIKKIINELDYKKDSEITFELNPSNMDLEKLKSLKELGINRLSIGMQSFNDEILKLMGREHSSLDSIKTYEDARKAGFENISIDLIFAVPTQTMEDLKNDIKMVEKLKPDHISIYSLIWEEGSMFYKKLRENKIEKLSEDLEADMYEYIIESLKKLGYEHYEISSFCLNKKYGRHNIKYWNNKEFIGVGISASSYYDKKRFKKISKLKQYYDMIDRGLIPIDENSIENVSKLDLEKLEYIIGLRNLKDGIKYNEKDSEKISKFINQGLLILKDDRLYLTKKGIFLLDEISIEMI